MLRKSVNRRRRRSLLQADVMVVVGDRKSANTRHLTEICKENCTRVYQIEDADELSPDMFHGCTVAGLTAGALHSCGHH